MCHPLLFFPMLCGADRPDPGLHTGNGKKPPELRAEKAEGGSPGPGGPGRHPPALPGAHWSSLRLRGIGSTRPGLAPPYLAEHCSWHGYRGRGYRLRRGSLHGSGQPDRSGWCKCRGQGCGRSGEAEDRGWCNGGRGPGRRRRDRPQPAGGDLLRSSLRAEHPGHSGQAFRGHSSERSGADQTALDPGRRHDNKNIGGSPPGHSAGEQSGGHRPSL